MELETAKDVLQGATLASISRVSLIVVLETSSVRQPLATRPVRDAQLTDYSLGVAIVNLRINAYCVTEDTP